MKFENYVDQYVGPMLVSILMHAPDQVPAQCLEVCTDCIAVHLRRRPTSD